MGIVMLDGVIQGIRSGKNFYRIGERHLYLYYLHQNHRGEGRDKAIAADCDKYQLNSDERAKLKEMIAELDSRRHKKAEEAKKPQPAWKSEAATEKQIAALQRAGWHGDPATITKGRASTLIWRLKQLSQQIKQTDDRARDLDGIAAEIAFEALNDLYAERDRYLGT